MKKANTIRRIIGITALVLWVVAIVPLFFLGYNDRIVWRLDQWALWFAPALTLVFTMQLYFINLTMEEDIMKAKTIHF